MLDDIWRVIFSKLTWEDRLPLEVVCKRWERLMPYHDIGTVNVNAGCKSATQIEMRCFGTDQLTSCYMWRPNMLITLIRCLFLERRRHKLKFTGLSDARQSENKNAPVFVLSADILQVLIELNVDIKVLALSSSFLEHSAVALLSAFPNISQLAFADVVQLPPSMNLDPLIYKQAKSRTMTILQHEINSFTKLQSLQLFYLVPQVQHPTLRHLKITETLATKRTIHPNKNTSTTDCQNLESLILTVLWTHWDFGPLIHLRTLTIRDESGIFTKNDLIHLCSSAPNLTSLDMFNCCVADFSCIGRLHHLLKLRMSHCVILDANIENLQACASLEYLAFRHCSIYNANPYAIFDLATHLPHLMRLDYVGHRILAKQPITNLFDKCSHLQGLDLSDCVFNFDFTCLLKHINGHLRWISFEHCDCMLTSYNTFENLNSTALDRKGKPNVDVFMSPKHFGHYSTQATMSLQNRLLAQNYVLYVT